MKLIIFYKKTKEGVEIMVDTSNIRHTKETKIEQVDIYGYKFQVLFIDKDDERIKGNDGLVLYNEFLILIRNDLNKQMMECILRHEITHAIMCVQGRWSHIKLTQEDMCEFIGFNAPFICEKASEIMRSI